MKIQVKHLVIVTAAVAATMDKILQVMEVTKIHKKIEMNPLKNIDKKKLENLKAQVKITQKQILKNLRLLKMKNQNKKQCLIKQINKQTGGKKILNLN